MTSINAEQLFRELDTIKEMLTANSDLMRDQNKTQNGRIRRLEIKVAAIWYILVVVGLTALAAIPVVYAR